MHWRVLGIFVCCWLCHYLSLSATSANLNVADARKCSLHCLWICPSRVVVIQFIMIRQPLLCRHAMSPLVDMIKSKGL